MSAFLLTRLEPSKRVRSAAYLEDASTSDSPSTSPMPSPSTQLIVDASSRAESRPGRGHNDSQPIKATLRTPLLMPPPSTRMGAFKNNIELQWHYFQTWYARNRQVRHLIFKLFVFLVKMLSITRPCAPFAMREVVWWPLMSLSALELALGHNIGWGGMGILGLVHVLVLGLVMQFGGGLCVSQRGLNWTWRDD